MDPMKPKELCIAMRVAVPLEELELQVSAAKACGATQVLVLRQVPESYLAALEEIVQKFAH